MRRLRYLLKVLLPLPPSLTSSSKLAGDNRGYERSVALLFLDLLLDLPLDLSRWVVYNEDDTPSARLALFFNSISSFNNALISDSIIFL